jgi:hypothetical protein
MGMDETHVRKISGHAPGSKEFYRYVVITQDRVDEQFLSANEKLTEEFLIKKRYVSIK